MFYSYIFRCSHLYLIPDFMVFQFHILRRKNGDDLFSDLPLPRTTQADDIFFKIAHKSAVLSREDASLG